MIGCGNISIPGGTATLGAGFVPTQLSGLVLWLRADLGITLGGTLLLTGTSPAITISGTATTTPGLRIKVTTGGTLGTAKGDISADNGATFFATGVLLAASLPLTGPCAGITAACAAGTYVLNDTFDATVSQWNDQSGQANHVAQVTAANQPIFVAANGSYSSRPTIKFTSQSLAKTATNLFGSGAYSIALAYNIGGTLGTSQGIFCNTRDPSALGMAYYSLTGTRDVPHISVQDHSDGAFGTSAEIACITRPAATVPSLLINGTTSALSGATATLSDPTGTAVLSIGSFASNNTPMLSAGNIAEVVAYNVALSAGQALTISRYLGSQYGIAVA